MQETTKKAILVFGGAALLYWIFKPKPRKSLVVGNTAVQEVAPEERAKITPPTMTKSDAKANPQAAKAFKVLKSYIDAYNNGETQATLDELNGEFGNSYGMTVYRRRQDNKLAVKDLNGNDIIVNNG